MGALAGTVWPWVGLVAVVAVLLIGMLLRYRMLERRGSGLPPGTGGARLVGMTGEVVAAPRDSTPAQVQVLGEQWRVARGAAGLTIGDRVVITDVEGVGLVVEAVDATPRSHGDVEGVS